MHPVHNFPSHFPKIQYNIILSSVPRFSDQKILYAFLISPMRVTFPAYLNLVEFINLITFEVHKLRSYT